MTKTHDTYFLNADVALKYALQQNRTVPLADSGKGLQICYYNGKPVNNAPENMIFVPLDKLFDYFINTKNRQPTLLSREGSQFSQKKIKEIEQYFEKVFTEVNEKRDQRRQHYIELIKNQEPDFNDNPKRVFLMTSRHTTVIQYSTKGIAKAFDDLGYDTKILIEEDDMQLLYKDLRVKEIYEFNPHITFNINHMFNDIVNEKTWNIVWWQDPMEELMNDVPINVRERDIVFSFDPSFDAFWIKKQVTPVYRQYFCIDDKVFYPDSKIERKNKVVFIGSSYINFFKYAMIPESFKQELISWLEKGKKFSENDVKILGDKYSLSFEHYPVVGILQGIVRDTTIQWLCEESDLEVEIYGRNWEEYEIVKPFFKGEVPHGKAVADIYCSAKYALSCQGSTIQSQRLAEIAACGAFPVVYDSRPFSPDPLWEDQYLFFRTRNELKEALKKEPKMYKGTFERIKSKFSYECFAKQIDRMIPKR